MKLMFLFRISHIFTTPVTEKNKQSNTYLAPFETDKGRNKNEKLSKSRWIRVKTIVINIDVKTSKRKHHTRCKSGFTKLSKRNNLNKGIFDALN
jgi:hypothetical protein